MYKRQGLSSDAYQSAVALDGKLYISDAGKVYASADAETWTEVSENADVTTLIGASSNYLLWQIAYSELYFCDTFWPDFNEEDLHKAIASYQNQMCIRDSPTGADIQSICFGADHDSSG